VFFVFYGATWLSQDCARPAIASDLFQKSLAQGLIPFFAKCFATHMRNALMLKAV